MIDFIEGRIIRIDRMTSPYSIVVQGGSMGFRLFVSASTLQNMSEVGKEVLVYTHLNVREDEVSLFGFGNPSEREMFYLLLHVSGVGPKMALGILSTYPLDTLKQAIRNGNEAMLTKITGVGKKTAQRLLLELKDKLKAEESADDSFGTGDMDSFQRGDLWSEAVDALMALGYSNGEAQQALNKAKADDGQTVEGLLRVALKNLARL